MKKYFIIDINGQFIDFDTPTLEQLEKKKVMY